MNRHRQQAFTNPVDVPEMAFEHDPERALWVPGRKRIFLPTPRAARTFAWTDLIVRDTTDVARARELARMERMLEILCGDCSPSRGQYLVIPQQAQILPRPRGYRPYLREGW